MLRPLLLLTLALPLTAQETAPAPAASAPIPVAPAAPVEQILRPPEPGRFAELFRRFRTEHAALSPDGRYVAYSIRNDEEISVVVLDREQPDALKTRVVVINDDAATPMLSESQREKTPGRIRWMRWVTPNRLVVETNRVHVGGSGGAWASQVGAVLAFDADGANARQIASPEDIPELVMDGGARSLFSTARGNSAGFNSRLWTPDQPVPSPGDDTPDEADPLQPAIAGDADLAGADLSVTLPRSLRVLELDAQRAGAVTLVSTGAARGTGSRGVGFHSLDAISGQLTNLHDQLVALNRHHLLDRLGRPRLALPNHSIASFPFDYEYLGPDGRSRARPLGEVSGLGGFRLSPENFFGERAIPVGFDENPDVLYYASNVGRDTFALYSWNLATNQRGSLALENPGHDLVAAPAAGYGEGNTLVFDRYTRALAGVRYQATLRTTAWLRPEWQTVQAELERALPGRCVDLLEWDESGRHFLVSTEGPADPGAFYFYDRTTARLTEFVRRAPWIDREHLHATVPFGFTTTAGTRISGLVTVPSQPRMKPIPLLVLCPDQPWERVTPDFHTEVNALAGMGFAVVQFNGRGTWGFGRKQREALTAGYDLVQVEDVVTTVETLSQLFNVNRNRVALLGRGHGGFIALRALQSHPDLFRCAVAIDAPVDLGDWLNKMKWTDEDVFPHLTRAWLGDADRLKAAPLTRRPGDITKPILLLSYPGPDGAPRRPLYLANRRFAADVARTGTTTELGELPLDYVRGLPRARAEVFDRIEGFLNEHVYDYKVKLGDLKVLPEKK